jgi:hypothetical protein
MGWTPEDFFLLSAGRRVYLLFKDYVQPIHPPPPSILCDICKRTEREVTTYYHLVLSLRICGANSPLIHVTSWYMEKRSDIFTYETRTRALTHAV